MYHGSIVTAKSNKMSNFVINKPEYDNITKIKSGHIIRFEANVAPSD